MNVLDPTPVVPHVVEVLLDVDKLVDDETNNVGVTSFDGEGQEREVRRGRFVGEGRVVLRVEVRDDGEMSELESAVERSERVRVGFIGGGTCRDA